MRWAGWACCIFCQRLHVLCMSCAYPVRVLCVPCACPVHVRVHACVHVSSNTQSISPCRRFADNSRQIEKKTMSEQQRMDMENRNAVLLSRLTRSSCSPLLRMHERGTEYDIRRSVFFISYPAVLVALLAEL